MEERNSAPKRIENFLRGMQGLLAGSYTKVELEHLEKLAKDFSDKIQKMKEKATTTEKKEK